MTDHDAPHSHKAERYDYQRQAWIGTDGRYLCCAHPPEMHCACYGRLHAGDLTADPPTRDPTLDHGIDDPEAAGIRIGNAIAAAVYGPTGEHRLDPDAIEAIRRVDARRQDEQDHPEAPIDDETGQRMY